MIYFIAWVVVGVCCYYLNKDYRHKYLPKYHTGMLFIQKSGEELHEPATPENVVRWSRIVENTMLFLDVLLAPLALFNRLKTLFRKGPSENILRMKSCCDEFVKRHGIVF